MDNSTCFPQLLCERSDLRAEVEIAIGQMDQQQPAGTQMIEIHARMPDGSAGEPESHRPRRRRARRCQSCAAARDRASVGRLQSPRPSSASEPLKEIERLRGHPDHRRVNFVEPEKIAAPAISRQRARRPGPRCRRAGLAIPEDPSTRPDTRFAAEIGRGSARGRETGIQGRESCGRCTTRARPSRLRLSRESEALRRNCGPDHATLEILRAHHEGERRRPMPAGSVAGRTVSVKEIERQEHRPGNAEGNSRKRVNRFGAARPTKTPPNAPPSATIR